MEIVAVAISVVAFVVAVSSRLSQIDLARTVSKWIAINKMERLAGLSDRSSANLRHSRRLLAKQMYALTGCATAEHREMTSDECVEYEQLKDLVDRLRWELERKS